MPTDAGRTGNRVERNFNVNRLSAAVVVVCALIAAGAAGASTSHGSRTPVTVAPPINWGVADDASKYADDGGSWFYQQLAGANLTENRWTLAWNPSNPTAITELPFLQRAAPKAQAAGVHVVLALYSTDAHQHDPTAFCAWAQLVAETVKQWGIHDFIVWNEPNTLLYWAPQKDDNGNDVARVDRVVAGGKQRLVRRGRTSRSRSCVTSAPPTAPRAERRRSWTSSRSIRTRTRPCPAHRRAPATRSRTTSACRS